MTDRKIVPRSAQDAISLERADDGSVTLWQHHDHDNGERHYIEIAKRHVPDVIRALQAAVGEGGGNG